MGTLVLVEDDPIIRGYLEALIYQVDSSQKVFSTAYAVQAVEYAQQNKVDSFVLDIQLLDYSGVVLAEQIRQMDGYKLTPIVFITGDATQELKAFRNTQCYRFITKPFREVDVLEVLRTILTRSQGTPEVEKRLLLKQRGFTLAVSMADLLYIESLNRRVSIVTRKETLNVASYTLGKLTEELDERFFQCHRSFVVNSEWIQRVNRVTMCIQLAEDRGSIPYGEKYRERLRAWL